MSEGPWPVSIVGQGEEDPRTLVLHPLNPKVHPPAQDAVVAASLGRWGWLRRGLKNVTTGHILDGHERIKLAIARGEATVPLDYCQIPESEEGAVLLTLDQSAALAQPHWERWSALHREAQAQQHGPELLAFWAQFAAQQAGEEVEVGRGAAGWQERDDAAGEQLMAASAEVQAAWQVAVGDVWEVGPHRLSCGDSRDRRVVGRLMQGGGPSTAQAVVTDPIYGQRQPGVPHDAEDVGEVARAAARVLPGTDLVCAVFQSPRQVLGWTDALVAAGFAFERLLWMYKAAQCTYPWRGWLLKSEAIILASKGEPGWHDVHPYAHDCYYLHEVKGELPEDVGWHGSVKPLAVVADLVQRLSAPGGVVFDGFVGSGTTLLACEQTGRVCRAVDVEPACVAVTLERYFRATGIRPQRAA
jgi:hypothetical protein